MSFLRHGKTAGYLFHLVWSCCNCRMHGGMNVDSTLACTGCGHHRCSDCHVEQVKTANRVAVNKASSEVPSNSATGTPEGTLAGINEIKRQEIAKHKEIARRKEIHDDELDTELDRDFERTQEIYKLARQQASERRGHEIASTEESLTLGVKWFDKSSADAAIPEDSRTQSLAPIGQRMGMASDDISTEMGESKLRYQAIPAVSLIPQIFPQESGEPLFPLDMASDSDIVTLWHEHVLPTIEAKQENYKGLTAIHLFRQSTNGNSHPTVLVSIENPAEEAHLHKELSKLIDEPLRLSFRISFETSCIRRTMGTGTELPPICRPRNTEFQQLPSMGASVGLQFQADCTATLGGYVAADGQVMILTVDHLIPTELSENKPIFLTHSSAEESKGTTEWNDVRSCFHMLRNCCSSCRILLYNHFEDIDFYKPVSLPNIDSACSTAKFFSQTKENLHQKRPSNVLGSLKARSEHRSAVTVADDGNYLVEMDWALFSTEGWSDLIEPYAQQISEGMSFHEIIPGAPVYAVGRTSGYQTGVINSVMSIVRHGGRFTREWSICKDENLTFQEWLEGGIGVDGDSGSWILGAGNVVYGMVWGRDRPTTNPISLFTPIVEIVADIKQKAGFGHVGLPTKEGAHLTVKEGKQKEETFMIPNKDESRSDEWVSIVDEKARKRKKAGMVDLVPLVEEFRLRRFDS